MLNLTEVSAYDLVRLKYMNYGARYSSIRRVSRQAP